MLDSQKGPKMKYFAKFSHQGTPEDKFRQETMRDCDLIGPPVVAKISLDGTSTLGGFTYQWENFKVVFLKSTLYFLVAFCFLKANM